MWISTKAQYGLRALVEIGRRPGEAVPLKDVAANQGLSQHYLEQIASNLRRAGFIRSVRGAHGGYKLTRTPDLINTWDVVVAMEGSLAPVACVEEGHSCEREGVCATQDLWQRVEGAVRGVLGGTTLADLIRENERIEHARLVQLEPLRADVLTPRL
ncbi:RrF2 family transcriptional regulator [Deinococcus maricopensis]|uniref:Transcriptional regulator, BadM/Rrf2 family n=1 Tax=Deinococcus maricopensis (strain DSM 21211 / LMG 22137 / NRRL B-23946 / LB-34) TaxID=709986 RepID=E8U9C3_DEIML|nr:RrF2 family transcriptional regulator [Deinococcus maricopensis]ADV67662.1 transcriptional regulator, BadM/Rrf2 family [Deinococcus maricopensis DSM 21211]